MDIMGKWVWDFNVSVKPNSNDWCDKAHNFTAALILNTFFSFKMFGSIEFWKIRNGSLNFLKTLIFLLRIRKYIKARLTKHSILISSIISSWRGYNGGEMGSRRYCKCETNSNEWCDITHNVFVKLIQDTLLSFKNFGSINFFSKKRYS